MADMLIDEALSALTRVSERLSLYERDRGGEVGGYDGDIAKIREALGAAFAPKSPKSDPETIAEGMFVARVLDRLAHNWKRLAESGDGTRTEACKAHAKKEVTSRRCGRDDDRS